MELEALSYTYPELKQLDNERTLLIDLQPRSARQAFVAASLQLRIPDGYPESAAPIIELREPKGLGDRWEAELLRRLEAEAADLVGGPALGQLVELCQDLLFEFNAPDGEPGAWVFRCSHCAWRVCCYVDMSCAFVGAVALGGWLPTVGPT